MKSPFLTSAPPSPSARAESGGCASFAPGVRSATCKLSAAASGLAELSSVWEEEPRSARSLLRHDGNVRDTEPQRVPSATPRSHPQALLEVAARLLGA